MRFFKISLILLTFILLVGCFWNSDDYDKETISKVENAVESYLRNNFKNINKIEFDKGDFKSQMGGFLVTGKVNEISEFSISIDDNHNVGSIGIGDDFPNRKEECKEKTCDY